nr:dehydrogenase [Vulcanisaeta sp.]
VTLDELRSRKIVKIKPRYLPTEEPDALPLPNLVEPEPLGNNEVYLVFASHPLYTNTQFREVYGELEPIVYTHDYEGIVYLSTSRGTVRVKAVKDPRIPPGVAVMYKNGLVDLDGKPVNSIIEPNKGKYAGTPRLNGIRVRITIVQNQ